jgi:hypothetical protein
VWADVVHAYIPALGVLRQEDGEFEAVTYIVRP